jgi:predicted ATPase
MSERDEELWCIAELLRIKGELLQSEGGIAGQQMAEQQFLQSLDWARRQKVLSWELRTALSLARLRQRRGLHRDAHDLLASVFGRFSDGFKTADLRASKALIDELSTAHDY